MPSRISTPGGIFRNQNLRLLFTRCGIGTGFDHRDHDLAARITGAGNVELLAVDDPFVAIEHRARADVFCIRRRQARFGHGVGRADLASQQGFQPLFFLLFGADALQHFHVACIGCAAIQGFRRQSVLAQFGGNVGIV